MPTKKLTNYFKALVKDKGKFEIIKFLMADEILLKKGDPRCTSEDFEP